MASRKLKVYTQAEHSKLGALSVFDESKKSGKIVVEARSTLINSPDLNAQMGNAGSKLDFPIWLPFSAPHYNISADVKDYVIKPVVVMPSDLPNRNGVGFPLTELIKFQPDFGMQSYKTWKGKPTHYEHANEDILKAYGVILDSYIRPMTGWSGNRLWKVLLLLAFDRSKHPDIAERILTNDLNSFSMGAMVGSYTCSMCNVPLGACNHIDPKAKQVTFYEKDGMLAYKNVKDIVGFETSAVETPAYISAISDTTLRMDDYLEGS